VLAGKLEEMARQLAELRRRLDEIERGGRGEQRD
jgi:hypothetical protein